MLLEKIYDLQYLHFDRLAERQLKLNYSLVDDILLFNPASCDFATEEERSYPGCQEFIRTGYWKKMLKRYFGAGSRYCRNKSVLDTCCGLGWGTKIISHYADSVLAFDQDRFVVDLCKKTWGENKIRWKVGDALEMAFLGGEKFDVVLGMETIEHFSYEEAIQYVENISLILKKNGVFVGTSSFPHEKVTARELCSKNEFHKYIFTLSEMNHILGTFFSKYKVLNNWLFVARK